MNIKEEYMPENGSHFVTPPLPRDTNTKNNNEKTPTVLPLNMRLLDPPSGTAV